MNSLVVLLVGTFALVSAQDPTFTCYTCTASWYNGVWNGDQWCNETLGTPPGGGVGEQTGCAQCVREMWRLDGGDFIVQRQCELPLTGEARELMQVAQTCFAYGIKGGTYERCACTAGNYCNSCALDTQCPPPNFQDCSIQLG